MSVDTAKLRKMLAAEVASDEWWNGLSPKEQQAYLQAHPNSWYSHNNHQMHPRHEKLTRRYEGDGDELNDSEMDELTQWENGKTPEKYKPKPQPAWREGTLNLPMRQRIDDPRGYKSPRFK